MTEKHIGIAECNYNDEILRLKCELEISNDQNESIKSLYDASQIKLHNIQSQLDGKANSNNDQALIGCELYL